ncbi:MAG: SoxR reducing system RseC family protein [Spirochaetales bacterium]|jgi:sigma-E factor negative regulatory protein RseC|nr:SoxR reducing system RseC family protein [Spirochaetales bacterium]
MFEIVTVTKIVSKQMLEVSCTSSACNGCKGEAFCNTKGKRFEAWNKHMLPAEPGSTVEIYLQPGRTIAGTLITLIFPLLLFPLGYYLSGRFGSGELASFFFGLLGILVGFLGVWIYFRSSQNHYLPVVERILSDEKEN